VPGNRSQTSRGSDRLDLLFLQRHLVGARQPSRVPRIVQLRAALTGPLVAMITTVAKTTITPLKIRNLAVFDPGTTSYESWLIAASKLAWKIATSSTLYPVRL
jgi:hypothetical protein